MAFIDGVSNKTVRNATVGTLALLFLAVSVVAFMTHRSTFAARSHFWAFAVENHTWIMATMAALGLLLGLTASQFFYREIKRKEKDTEHILGVVLLFLNQEEREIVNYLVAQGGATSQAEIARLPHMNRVKAHRSLQKMQEKQILVVVPHGKVRRVMLKENILELLREERD